MRSSWRSGAGLLGALALGIFAVLPVTGVAQQVVELSGSDRYLEAEPTDVFTVGSISGEMWETFAGVNDLAFDGEGLLYILDGDNHRVVVVDEGGQLVREFGHEGGGPGEFQNPMSLVVLSSGEIVVFDLGHRAFQVFDATGEYLRQIPVDIMKGEMPGRDLFAHPSGRVISGAGQGVVVMVSGGSGPPPGVPIRSYSIEDEGGAEIMHSAWAPPRPEITQGGSVQSSGGRRMTMAMPAPRAFEPSFSMGVLPDGRIAYTDSTTYAVKVLSAKGEPDRVLNRSFAPREVTRRDQQAEKERRIAELESSEDTGFRFNVRTPGGGTSISQDAIKKMMLERMEDMTFWDEFPVLRRLAVDAEGRIWVERTAEDFNAPGPVDILDADGAYLATIPVDGMRIPDAFGPDGLVAYVETDELDVPTVVVKRLPRGFPTT